MSYKFRRYLIKRVAVFLITLYAAVTLNFLIPRLMPGDPLDAMMAQMSYQGKAMAYGAEMLEAYKIKFGLDKPLHTQYFLYLKNLLQGDLGISLMSYPESVTKVVSRYLGWTIGLLLFTTLISWVLGNLIGAYIGWKGEGKLSSILTTYSLIMSEIPYYIFALILVYVFAYYIPIFPLRGAFDINTVRGFNVNYILDLLWHAFLPAISIMLVSIGGWMLRMRSLIINILGEDYLLFAEAKGLKETTILTQYAIKNALLPQVTGLALSLGFIVNGAMLMEIIFAYPGMGRLFQVALGWRDYNILQAVFLMSTIGVLGGTFILDIIYPLLDPRVRKGQN